MDIWTVVRTILEKNPGINGGQLWRKVQEKTGLSRSTIYDHLYTFHNQDKIYRKKGRYWLSTIDSEWKGRRATLRHSQQLSLGLEAILAEDWTFYRPYEPSRERAQWRDKIEREGIRLKEFAIEHLRSGYPDTYDKLKRWRKLRERIKGKTDSVDVTEDVVNFVSWSREEHQKLLDRGVAVYQAFTSDIELIILKIEASKRLRGTCRLCCE